MSYYDKGMMDEDFFQKTSSNVRGTFDGWNGDEYEVEYTWEELYDLECQEADLLNDEQWLEERT